MQILTILSKRLAIGWIPTWYESENLNHLESKDTCTRHIYKFIIFMDLLKGKFNRTKYSGEISFGYQTSKSEIRKNLKSKICTNLSAKRSLRYFKNQHLSRNILNKSIRPDEVAMWQNSRLGIQPLLSNTGLLNQWLTIRYFQSMWHRAPSSHAIARW